MKKFYNTEKQRHLDLITKSFFGKDKGNGFFKGKQYPFVLRNGGNNLYEPIIICTHTSYHRPTLIHSTKHIVFQEKTWRRLGEACSLTNQNILL